MTIDVKLFATLRLHLGVASVPVEIDGEPTVRELLDLVSAEVGRDVREWLLDENDGIKTGTMILLDGHNILHADGLDTRVTTPNVAIFPPAGGG
jgi:molybdopterin synthase sulfur carrier subunit